LSLADRFKGLIKHRWLRVALIVFGLIVLTAASLLLLDYVYYNSRTYPWVMLENIDVGDRRWYEIEELLYETIWSTENISLNLPENISRTFSISELGLTWDKSETQRRIFQAGRGWRGYIIRLRSLLYEKPIVVRAALTVDESIFAQAISLLAEQIYRAPVDATFEVERDKVTIIPEQDGMYLQAGALRKAIYNALYQGYREVDVPVGDRPALRRAADLEGLGVRQVMASFYTWVAGGNPDRAYNIKLSTAKLNGILMAPGEIFSFNTALGRVTREKGYRYAPVIIGDELVPGLGGGICQVSTTIYNAALLANLKILERQNHSMPISYIPLGRDATVVYGSLDLRFKNNRDHYLLIGADLTDLKLTFRFFGLPMDERVEIMSSDHLKIPPPSRIEYTENLPGGVREVAREGRPGHRITTWRVVYRNDREISREMLDRDYYKPTDKIYRVGTGDD